MPALEIPNVMKLFKYFIPTKNSETNEQQEKWQDDFKKRTKGENKGILTSSAVTIALICCNRTINHQKQ